VSAAKSPLYERDLAVPVKDYLRAEGWTLYEEVPYLGKVPDIVCLWQANSGGEQLLATVELKTSLGFPIIVQGLHNLEHAHESWIAVPAGKDTPERALALELCHERGLGVLEVRPLSKLEEERVARGVELTEPRVVQVHDATRRRIADNGEGLRRALAPEHRSGAYAGAGTKTGKRWNATQAAYQRVRDHLTEAGGAVLLEVVLRETAAPAFLRDHIARAVVPRVRLNGTDISAGVMLETVLPGDEAPIFSKRSLRTRRPA
jgi:hypothetical protein